MEVGEAVLALNLVDSELDVSERLLLVLVQVGERKLEDSTLEGVVGVLCRFEGKAGVSSNPARPKGLKEGRTKTLGSVDKGLANVSDLKHGGGLDVVPFCARAEGRKVRRLSTTVEARTGRTLSGERVDDLFLDTLLSL